MRPGPAWLLPEVTETRQPYYIARSRLYPLLALHICCPLIPSLLPFRLLACVNTDRQSLSAATANLSTASALYDGSNRGFTVGTRVSEASTTLTRTTDRPTDDQRIRRRHCIRFDTGGESTIPKHQLVRWRNKRTYKTIWWRLRFSSSSTLTTASPISQIISNQRSPFTSATTVGRVQSETSPTSTLSASSLS